MMITPRNRRQRTADAPKTSVNDSGKGRGASPVYELFVLGELMVRPMHGYKLHEIVNRVLGPVHQISWGTLYPLIRRLEEEGLTTSEIEKRQAGSPLTERGPQRRIYSLTEAGQDRFFYLMLNPGDYSRDYPDLFAIKLTKLGFLSVPQQLAVLQHQDGYLQYLQDFYERGNTQVSTHPGIADKERPYILMLIDYRLQQLKTDREWVGEQIARLWESA